MEELCLSSKKEAMEKKSISKMMAGFRREKHIWIICIPIIVWVLVFCYYPMYGLMAAFFNYIPGKELFQCEWKGLFYFQQFFNSPDILLILRNTLAISGLNILFGFPLPIILALLINELRNKRFKKTVQTISYLPYFISWVVAASLAYTFLSSDGALNAMLLKLGFIHEPIAYLGEGSLFWGIITSANIWKGIGWSSIIYLSAIAGIDKQLYEAGEMDGLGRFGKIWHITLPGIRVTVILLFILGLGNILNAGFEQQLLLGAPQTRDYWDVIDTYSYRYGIQLGRYSYATAVGLIKSTIALALVFLANRVSKKFFDVSVV